MDDLPPMDGLPPINDLMPSAPSAAASSPRHATTSAEGGAPSAPQESKTNWEDVSAEEIMLKVGPGKSLSLYEKEWARFGRFLKKELGSYEPIEDDYIRFCYFLRKAKTMKYSTLWSIHSRLRNCHARRFATDINKFPKLTMMLKSYESGYVRKTSNVFNRDEVERILQLDKHCTTWVLRKAITAVGFCGALRCAELRSITLGSIKLDDEGAWISFTHAKQRGEAKENEFIVPYNRSEPHICMATRLIHYRKKLLESLPTLGLEDALFRRPLKKGYGDKPLGRNTLGKVPYEMALELRLENPKRFTGHGFR